MRLYLVPRVFVERSVKLEEDANCTKSPLILDRPQFIRVRENSKFANRNCEKMPKEIREEKIKEEQKTPIVQAKRICPKNGENNR